MSKDSLLTINLTLHLDLHHHCCCSSHYYYSGSSPNLGSSFIAQATAKQVDFVVTGPVFLRPQLLVVVATAQVAVGSGLKQPIATATMLLHPHIHCRISNLLPTLRFCRKRSKLLLLCAWGIRAKSTW